MGNGEGYLRNYPRTEPVLVGLVNTRLWGPTIPTAAVDCAPGSKPAPSKPSRCSRCKQARHQLICGPIQIVAAQWLLEVAGECWLQFRGSEGNRGVRRRYR